MKNPEALQPLYQSSAISITIFLGISPVPEKYEQVIQQVLQDCDGTANISDDIIVYGLNQVGHEKRLEKVLTRLEKRGLTLNDKKCVIGMPKLAFMGLLLSNSGIGPTEGKFRAVLEARTSECYRGEKFLRLGEFQCNIYSRHWNDCLANEKIDKARHYICFWS